jgi:hypothetical protein
MAPHKSGSSEGRQTIVLVVGLIAAVAVFTILMSLFLTKPWQSDDYKECVATLEQLNGGEDVPDSIIDSECGPYE